MACEILMQNGFQPRRIAADYDTTVLNLSQAISNGVPFLCSDGEDGNRVATRVAYILEIREVGEDE